MSLCDTCRQPGACCRDMSLHTATWGNFYPEQWPGDAQRYLDRHLPGHPFIPLRLEMYPPETLPADAVAPYGMGKWACTRLTSEGRCGDYENRPALCKAYEPASDRLCVMYVPPSASGE